MEEKFFTVSPMSQGISLFPGETYSGSIKVANPADAKNDFSYTVSVAPYGVSGEDYAANLTDISAYSEIVKWVKIESPNGTLRPNTATDINFTIEVPEDVPAGGQYFAITVNQNPDAIEGSGAQIQNILQIASIVYADVAGETVHDGSILQNNVPNFVFSTPITIGTMLENKGNIHSAAMIDIEVTDAFTGRVIFPSEGTLGSFTEIVMPETTRYATREISNLPALGIVRISQTVNYEGQTSTNVQNVIICPIWFMALVFTCIAAISTFIISRIIRHHKRKIAKEI